MSDGPLAGLGVLVTRPDAQSAELIEAIESRGGSTVRFPVLDIVGRPMTDLRHEATTLAPADVVIFVSANAVRYGFDAVDTAQAQVAVIGPATAKAVLQKGGRVDIQPVGGANSEHLLAADELQQLQGKSITIVRGQSGRELLAETLTHRGANVQYLDAYRRKARAVSPAERSALQSAWDGGEINAIIVMSVASLDAMLDALPPACLDRLPETPLVGPGERVIQTALERLPGVICVQSAGPGALDIIDALITVLHQDTDPEHD